MTIALLLSIVALPPINSTNDALTQLATKSKEAIANVDLACRGKLRHALRDEPRVLQAMTNLASSGSAEIKKAVLDAHRCFSPAKFVAILGPLLSDADPTIVSYAAEVSARVADPAVLPLLLDRLQARKSACMTDLALPELEVCVWLTYAPGASLAGADQETRAKAASLAAEMLECPHPKVREVAVETLASSGLSSYAKAIADLIAKEKKGLFAKKNDAALLTRFEQSRKRLTK